VFVASRAPIVIRLGVLEVEIQTKPFATAPGSSETANGGSSSVSFRR
jgi:hypothetical protein